MYSIVVCESRVVAAAFIDRMYVVFTGGALAPTAWAAPMWPGLMPLFALYPPSSINAAGAKAPNNT